LRNGGGLRLIPVEMTADRVGELHPCQSLRNPDLLWYLAGAVTLAGVLVVATARAVAAALAAALAQVAMNAVVLLAIAIYAVAEPDTYWTPLMYSDRGWLPLAAARAAHHAGPIGKPGHHLRDEDGGPARVRDTSSRP
jgi:hypothetical protein